MKTWAISILTASTCVAVSAKAGGSNLIPQKKPMTVGGEK